MMNPLERLDSKNFDAQVNMMPQTARVQSNSNPFKQAIEEEKKQHVEIASEQNKEQPEMSLQEEPVTVIDEPTIKENEVTDFTTEVILDYMNKPKTEEMFQKEISQIDCYKCNGTKKNKKGTKDCKKCDGTGSFQSKLLEAAMDAMKTTVKDYCANQFRSMIIDRIAEQQKAQAQVVHEKFVCDSCGVGPIVGVRYMCTVRHDYDLCEKCERTKVHEYPLLKIRKPEQAPVKVVCQYKPSSVSQLDPMNRKNFGTANVSKPEKPIKHSARFVKENFGDQHAVSSNESFIKEWTFRNDGEQAWPENAQFIQTNGDELGFVAKKIDKIVGKDEEYTWSVELKSPAKAGRYTTYFRMTDDNNHRFGHKVWVDILVIEKPQEPVVEAKEDASIKSEPVSTEVYSEASKVVRPVKMVEPPQKACKLPTYSEKCDEIESAVKKHALLSLYDMGFLNFNVNSQLYDKHQNVQTIASILLDQQLNESDMDMFKSQVEEDEDLYN